tara:strand:- start:2079 stop:3971 length:1893 start_codon:yes stop_codon:yes gene_type:complete
MHSGTAMKNNRFLNLNKAKGFTLAELAVVASILGTLAYYAGEQQEVINYVNDLEQVERDIENLQLAYNQYYLEYRRPPATINELATLGLYSGSLESPFGTQYEGVPNGRGYQFVVDTLDNGPALTLSEKAPNATGVANRVSYNVPIPALETIASQYLHRQAVAGRPELNQLETNLDINGFDILNVSDLETNNIVTDRITTNVAEIDVLQTVDTLEFGTNSIQAVGNTLRLNAGTVDISNNISVDGDLLMLGGNITGVDQITASLGDIDELNSDEITAVSGNFQNFTTDNLDVDNFSSQSAVINTLDVDDLTFTDAVGDSINVTNADIDNFVSDTSVINTATINDLQTTNLTADSGNITNLTSNNFTTNNADVTGTATINSADIDSLTAQNANLVNVTSNTSTINTAVIGNLSAIDTRTQNLITDVLRVNGQSNINNANIDEASIRMATVDRLNVLNELVAANAQFINASGNRIDFDTLNGNSATFSTLNVANRLTASDAQFDNARVNVFRANNFRATGNSTIDNLDADNVNVAGTFSASDVNANDVNVSGDTTTQNLYVNNLTMSTYDIASLEATTVNASQVNGGNFTGNNYYATGDFRTSAGNSVNSNKALYDSINSLWQSCVAVDGCR